MRPLFLIFGIAIALAIASVASAQHCDNGYGRSFYGHGLNFGYAPRVSSYDCYDGHCHLRSLYGGGYRAGYFVNRWYYDSFGRPYSVRVFVRGGY